MGGTTVKISSSLKATAFRGDFYIIKNKKEEIKK